MVIFDLKMDILGLKMFILDLKMILYETQIVKIVKHLQYHSNLMKDLDFPACLQIPNRLDRWQIPIIIMRISSLYFI